MEMKKDKDLFMDVEELSRQVLEALDNQIEKCDFQKREIEKLSNIIKERDLTIDTYTTNFKKEPNVEDDEKSPKNVADREKILRFTKNVQSDLKCSVCHDMILFSTATNCGHLFCEECIEAWIQQTNSCPICRIMITSLGKVRSIDNFITVFVDTFLSEEYKATHLIRKSEKRRRLEAGAEANIQDTAINSWQMDDDINLENLNNSIEANIRRFEENVTSYRRRIALFEEEVTEYGNAANLNFIANFNASSNDRNVVESDGTALINDEFEVSRRYLSDAIDALFQNYSEHSNRLPIN